ncbi:LuxR family transcriptional regulator [Rhodobacter sp. NTK016B]|uniref:helix-turn-helix transcriptional regulator n=1 Tax=Rhodobacter sp. NTK016B TaxID=2759676 RepID=UPI001A8FE18F|nr:LuxR family transcriptional regulator [Rhodobacter sp. NTK016B]
MSDLFQFPEKLANAPNVTAACAELVTHMEPFGFSVYAIGAVPHPSAPYPADFLVTNWPQRWQKAYFERQFGERDPTLRAISSLGRAFTIGDLRAGRVGFQLSPDEREVIDFAAELGLPHGLIVPIYRAQGYTGIACLVGTGPDPDPETRTRLQFLAEHTHDRLRELSASGRIAPEIRLSNREIEILTYARQGLTDAKIAEAAEISIRTVRFHFENARRKLAARSRAEAIAIAVARHLLPA